LEKIVVCPGLSLQKITVVSELSLRGVVNVDKILPLEKISVVSEFSFSSGRIVVNIGKLSLERISIVSELFLERVVSCSGR